MRAYVSVERQSVLRTTMTQSPKFYPGSLPLIDLSEVYLEAFRNFDINEDLQAVLIGTSRGLGHEDDYLYKVAEEELKKMNEVSRFYSYNSTVIS